MAHQLHGANGSIATADLHGDAVIATLRVHLAMTCALSALTHPAAMALHTQEGSSPAASPQGQGREGPVVLPRARQSTAPARTRSKKLKVEKASH